MSRPPYIEATINGVKHLLDWPTYTDPRSATMGEVAHQTRMNDNNTPAANIDTLAAEFGLASFARNNDGAFRCNGAQANDLANKIQHAMRALAAARAEVEALKAKG